MTRALRRGPALALIATGALLVASCAGPARPNILLVVIDTARADRFSTNGYARDTTPAIAALGRDGAVYLNAYATSPWTLPSHASMFTGLYPSSHGADSGRLKLDDQLPFLASRLKAAGYSTIACVANPWVGKDYNFHIGFDIFDEIWREVGDSAEDAGAATISERMTLWLSRRARNEKARAKPFFVFINYFEAHLPYNPPEPERSRFLARGRGPQAGAGSEAEQEAVEHLRRFSPKDIVRQILGVESLSRDGFRILSDLYDGEIAYVDRRLGEVIAQLRQHDLLDDTVIVVTSDHGEMLGEHDLVDHRLSLYEPVLRIPLVIRYPWAVRAGQRLDAPVLLQDLYPTLLWAAGIRSPQGGAPPPIGDGPAEARPLPGFRGLDTSEPRGRSASDPLIAEYARPGEFLVVMRVLMTGHDTTPWERSQVAFRVAERKLIWGSDGRNQLFDLGADPGEANDVAGMHGDQVSEYSRDVLSWLQRPTARPPLAVQVPGAATSH
jgi:arylsulfatase A-like enzyme